MKSRVRRTVTTVALLAALVFILSGCIHMNFSMKINNNGSVDWSYDMQMSDEILAMVNQSGTSASVWGDATTQAESQGFTVEQIPSKDGYSGIRATKHYKSIDEMNADNNKFAGTEGTSQGASESFTAKETKSFFATTYDIEMKMDASGAMATAQTQTGDANTDAMIQTMMEQMQINFEVTVPAKASVNNATSVSADGLTYTWKMDLKNPNDMKLTASVLNMTNVLLVGGGAAVVVILAVVIILLAVSASKKKARAAVAAAQPPTDPAV
jgi:hypothetical protein